MPVSLSISISKFVLSLIRCASSSFSLSLKYFMRSEEYPLSTSDNTRYHLIVWSAKESIFKSLMSGEINTMLNYYIPPFKLSEKGKFRASYPTAKQSFDVIYYSAEDYVLTVAQMI